MPVGLESQGLAGSQRPDLEAPDFGWGILVWSLTTRAPSPKRVEKPCSERGSKTVWDHVGNLLCLRLRDAYRLAA